MSDKFTTKLDVNDVGESFAINEVLSDTPNEEHKTFISSATFKFYDLEIDQDTGIPPEGSREVILEFHTPEAIRKLRDQINAFLHKSGW